MKYSLRRDIELFSYHFLSCYHKIVSHYHKLENRSHNLASHSHKIVSGSHKFTSRYHKILSHSHKLEICYNKMLTKFITANSLQVRKLFPQDTNPFPQLSKVITTRY